MWVLRTQRVERTRLILWLAVPLGRHGHFGLLRHKVLMLRRVVATPALGILGPLLPKISKKIALGIGQSQELESKKANATAPAAGLHQKCGKSNQRDAHAKSRLLPGDFLRQILFSDHHGERSNKVGAGRIMPPRVNLLIERSRLAFRLSSRDRSFYPLQKK